MLPTLHLANTDFEFELEGEASSVPHPILLQLQFLPLLMEGPESLVAVTELPHSEYLDSLPFKVPRLLTTDTQENAFASSLEVWGASKRIAAWANKHEIRYEIPPIEIVAKVHSKLFTFQHCPQLPGASTLSNKNELEKWLAHARDRVVLKTAFGVSARGHLHVDPSNPPPRTLTFCEREWQKGRAVIAEPWMERLLDFSTQWQVNRDGSFIHLGTTTLENDTRGGYVGTVVGELPDLIRAHLPQHMEEAEKLLAVVASHGYFGPVGLDAMIYGDSLLHPIVELNARKTMSLVALQLQQRHYPDCTLTIRYGKADSSSQGLLPERLGTQHFKRQLYLQTSPKMG